MNDIPKFKIREGGETVTYTATELRPGIFRLVLDDACHRILLVKYNDGKPVIISSEKTKGAQADNISETKTRSTNSLGGNRVAYDSSYTSPNIDFLKKYASSSQCWEPLVQRYETAIAKAKNLLDCNTSGKVGPNEWASILLLKDLYRSEKNPEFENVRLDQPSQLIGINSDYSYKSTLMRYSHWDNTLGALGLGKYKDKLQPGGTQNGHYYSGMSFEYGVPKLLKIIRADLGSKATGLSDIQVLRLAGANI